MLTTKPDTLDIDGIIYQIEKGELKVPQFQRDFVWSIDGSAKLIDSIIKGYPVGAFTFWKTKDRLRSVKNIGALKLPESPKNDFVNYVLDGQQRITSIYACIRGAVIGKSDYNQVFVDLDASEDERIVVTDIKKFDKNKYISLKDMLECNITSLFNMYSNQSDKIEKIQLYKDRIKKYQFSIIELRDAPLDIATEIFTRINTTGKSLSVFEIMCAKTYDEEKDFDLFEKRKRQIEKWESVNYETVPHQTVLQAIALCLTKNCKRKDILNLDKQQFISVWDEVDKAFDNAIDYTRAFYNIPVSKLLPYDVLLVPLVYFFYFNKSKPIGQKALMLQDYFWRCVLSKHFTEGVEGKLSTDCANIIEPIINGLKPKEKFLESVDISFEDLKKNGGFSLSSAYIKGLLCILAAQHPVSFVDSSSVVIDNAWLSQSNSKNYHHFFPRAYMRKNQTLIDDELVNHIANITIVDGYLNKNVIRDKSPKEYMGMFKNENKNICYTMNTHLIDIDNDGIWENDYNKFFKNRLLRLQEQLEERIILNENDRK